MRIQLFGQISLIGIYESTALESGNPLAQKIAKSGAGSPRTLSFHFHSPENIFVELSAFQEVN